MRRKLHKIAVLFMLVVLMLTTLTGCSAGSTIETTVAINEDLSGTRTMKVVIDDEIFSENFTGTVEDLKALIQTKCPADLTWTYDESTGAKTFTFVLNFTSPSDYDMKAQNLIAAGDENGTTVYNPENPILELYAPETIWANGFYLDENFDSEDLLEWLEDAIVAAGMVPSNEKGDIFTNGNSSVTFAGQTYEASSRITVDEIKYVEFNGFDIYTTIKGVDCFDRTIELVVPKHSMEASGTEIKEFVATMVPVGATTEWTTDDEGNSVYAVTKTDMTVEALSQFMIEYFGTEDTIVYAEESDSKSPFYLARNIREEYNLSNYYLEGADFEPEYNYYVKHVNGYVNPNNYDGAGEEFYLQDDGDIYYTSLEYLRFGLVKDFVLRKLDVETKSTFGGNFARTFVFEFDKVPAEHELVIINEKMDALLETQLAYEAEMEEAKEAENAEGEATEDTESTEDAEASEDTEVTEEGEVTEEEAEPEKEKVDYKKEFNVEYDGSIKKDVFTYTLKQSGSVEEMIRSSKAIFGEEGLLVATDDFGILKPKYKVGYHEHLYFGRLINSMAETAVVTHTAVLPMGTKVTYPTSDGGYYVVKGRTITTTETTSTLYIDATGQRINFWAIAIYLLIIAGVALVVVGANKAGLLDEMKAKSAQKAAEKAATKEAAVQAGGATPNVKDEKAFCKNCGKKLVVGAAFCGSCGTKVE